MFGYRRKRLNALESELLEIKSNNLDVINESRKKAFNVLSELRAEEEALKARNLALREARSLGITTLNTIISSKNSEIDRLNSIIKDLIKSKTPETKIIPSTYVR